MKLTEENRIRLNRLLVGLISLACLLTGASIGLFDSAENIWTGAFVRVGLLMGAVCLAMPTPSRPAAWAGFNPLWIPVLFAVLFIIAYRPRVMAPIAGVVFLLVFLLPLLTRGRR
ncbi:MAG: hypothetical protein KDA80_24285 [Planctomycetaceae bacterium]|nr:hypothetical protein [Planctomycetaceae bacterium]